MKLISNFALLILIIAILYLLISGNLFSRSPLIITGQLLAVALGIWARLSFQGGQFSIQAEPVAGPLLLTGPYHFIRHPTGRSRSCCPGRGPIRSCFYPPPHSSKFQLRSDGRGLCPGISAHTWAASDHVAKLSCKANTDR